MRSLRCWAVAGMVLLAMASLSSLCAAQAPDNFRWIDFQSPNDRDVAIWVTRALDGQKWTAIREIGVEFDAALVITSLRSSPQASPNRDAYSVWSVSLADRKLTHLVDGVNLRVADWLLLDVTGTRELGILYDDCNDCEATTYFTTLHYDLGMHTWAARWLQGGGKTIPVWTKKAPMGVTQTQVFAVVADSNGHEVLGTWNHMDYGTQKPAEDFVYRYDVDPQTSRERTQQLVGHDATNLKERLCRAQDAVPGLFRGQDSPLCETTSEKPRRERKPVITPPANNAGQSRPPGSH